jgi:hypothetical protein
MDIRNESGGITPAEGCMFAAMALFAILLVALLIIAALRFSRPPEGDPAVSALSPVPAGFQLG